MSTTPDRVESTRAILERMARRPDEGWPELLRSSESKLRVLIHFRLPGDSCGGLDADDLLQEVWAEAARCLDRFDYRGKGSLHRWLAGILKNKLLHARRSLPRSPVRFADIGDGAISSASTPHPELLEALQRTDSEHARTAERREIERRVREAIERLPDELRRAVLLRIYEGLTGSEAARLEGVDESTISLRFRRALETCALQLRDLVT